MSSDQISINSLNINTEENQNDIEGKRPSSSGSSYLSPTPLTKKGSNASIEFGRGERRSSSPPRSMLKHVTSGAGPPPKVTPQAAQQVQETSTSMILPQRFVVKYLGFRETSNLWGIKYTRRPVDEMVNDAKKSLSTSPDKTLALLRIEVSEEGITVAPMPQNTAASYPKGKFSIESISYGVQDLVYTRVFAMIVVRSTDKGQSEVKLSQLVNSSNTGNTLPFRCHAFVCDSRQTARKLTYSLASAFEVFSKKVASGKIAAPIKPKRFAIDLRPEEEIEAELQMEDSEA